MEFEFLYELTEPLRAELTAFYDSLPTAAIEQFPLWGEVVPFSGRVCRCVGRRGGAVASYANVFERVVGNAFLDFGPICADTGTAAQSIAALCDYYRGRGIHSLRIQPGPVPEGAKDFSRKLLDESRLKGLARVHAGWRSLSVDTSEGCGTAAAKYSKGHKSALKKSLRNGLVAIPAATDAHAEAFINAFVAMHRVRKLPVDPAFSRTLILAILSFLRQSGRGRLWVVCGGNGEVCGGIITVRQGTVVRYYKGAAHPDMRSHAVLHVAIDAAIRAAAEAGAREFDLWGYTPPGRGTAQHRNVNIFKQGFGAQPVEYPGEIRLTFHPLRAFLAGHAATLVEPLKYALRGGLRAMGMGGRLTGNTR